MWYGYFINRILNNTETYPTANLVGSDVIFMRIKMSKE